MLGRSRSLARLHLRGLLAGVGYYLVLVIAAVVLLLIGIAVPDETAGTIGIVNRWHYGKVPRIVEQIGQRGYKVRLFSDPREALAALAEEQIVLALDLRLDGKVTWMENSPQIWLQQKHKVLRDVREVELEALSDLRRVFGEPGAGSAFTVRNVLGSGQRRRFICGLATAIGGWFVGAVMSILVMLNIMSCRERLALVYSGRELLWSSLLVAAGLGLGPVLVILATAEATGAQLLGRPMVYLVVVLSILMGTAFGQVLSLVARRLSRSAEGFTLLSFLGISQGFIILAQYSGIVTGLSVMSEAGRTIAAALPLYPLVRLVEWGICGQRQLTDRVCALSLLSIAAWLVAQWGLGWALWRRDAR
jgi:hypothetical protein